MTKISVVLGTYNRHKFLKLTIANIRQELAKLSVPSEIIVVDGGSTDNTLEWLIKQKDIITIIQHNTGSWNNKPIRRRSWGYFMNLGFKCAQGKYICMLSDDCLVIPGSIQNGLALFEKKLHQKENIGALAFYWREWPYDSNYHVGVTIGNNVFVNHGMFLKKALEKVGYIDEDSYFFYYADGDLCLKLKQNGYTCIISSHSYVEHYPHANLKKRKTNLENELKDRITFLNRWKNNKNIFEEQYPPNDTKYFYDKTKTGKLFRKIEFCCPEIILLKTKRLIKNIIKK